MQLRNLEMGGRFIEVKKSKLMGPDTRVYVQNVPRNLSIQQIKDHFAKNFGEVVLMF